MVRTGVPSGAYHTTRPPSHLALHTKPSESTVRPSGVHDDGSTAKSAGAEIAPDVGSASKATIA